MPLNVQPLRRSKTQNNYSSRDEDQDDQGECWRRTRAVTPTKQMPNHILYFLIKFVMFPGNSLRMAQHHSGYTENPRCMTKTMSSPR